MLVETLDEKQMDVGGTLNYQVAVFFFYVVKGIRCRSKYEYKARISFLLQEKVDDVSFCIFGKEEEEEEKVRIVKAYIEY